MELWFLITKRVMTAVLRQPLWRRLLGFQQKMRKRRRKHGWGTLLQSMHVVGALLTKHSFCCMTNPIGMAKATLDRKCNYSLDIQVCGILHNIWFSETNSSLVRLSHCQIFKLWLQHSHTGSTHDSNCVGQNLSCTAAWDFAWWWRILWADSAYPVSCN